jgi:hypothetical protein
MRAGVLRAVTLIVVLATAASSRCTAISKPPVASFWFEDVAFQLPGRETQALGGPLNADDMSRIRSVAWTELRAAYREFPLTLEQGRGGIYRVAVLQDLGGRPFGKRTVYGDAGQSRTFGPLGGRGAVSFTILARNAVYYAPAGATRSQIIDAIGRGIGRAAVHEFAHLIVPDVNLHATVDNATYEYGSADRAVQYYGQLHWSIGREAIEKKLGKD